MKTDKLINKFQNKFTIDYIRNMTIDDYVIGESNKDSFCYWIEYKLVNAGEIRGSFSQKHGVYYNKERKDYHYNKAFHNDFEEVKEALISLITETKKLDEFEDIKSKFNGLVKYKIMYLYNPKCMIPSYVEDDLTRFCILLNINYKGTYESKQLALLHHRKEHYPNMSNLDFMMMLYETYGRGVTLKELEKDIFDSKKANLFRTKAKEIIVDNGDKPEPKVKAINFKGTKHYPRKRSTVLIARKRAGGKCELDNSHNSFISRNGETYLECHHLIPMCFQDEFKVSIDVPANVVCLCSECHNKIHYGKDYENTLKMLLKKRKQQLSICKIDINQESLTAKYEQIFKLEKKMANKYNGKNSIKY